MERGRGACIRAAAMALPLPAQWPVGLLATPAYSHLSLPPHLTAHRPSSPVHQGSLFGRVRQNGPGAAAFQQGWRVSVPSGDAVPARRGFGYQLLDPEKALVSRGVVTGCSRPCNRL